MKPDPSIDKLVERLTELLVKATPGPWCLSGARKKGDVRIGRDTSTLAVGPDGDAVAVVFHDDKTGRGYIDGKLIEAAVNALPLLLKALSHTGAGQGEAIPAGREDYRHKLWMVACHATGGGIPEIEGVDRSINDICVQISAHNNLIWKHAQEAALRTLPTTPPATDGFVLVPKEPTEAMLAAGGRGCSGRVAEPTMRAIWTAMLAAVETDHG